ERGGVVDAPGERRRGQHALQETKFAEAARIFQGDDAAIIQVVAAGDGAGGIADEAVEVERAELELGRGGGLGPRHLAEEVDDAARLAAAVKDRRGPLEELDPLDVGQLPRHEREVNEAVAAQLEVTDDKATHRELVEAVVRAGVSNGPGHVAEQVFGAE